MVELLQAQLQELQSLGVDIERGQPQTETTVLALERLIGAALPQSYREFIKTFGYAGPFDSVYLGVESPDTMETIGVHAVTQELRSRYLLPANLMVVRHIYDMQLCYCIDLHQWLDTSECGMVIAQHLGSRGCGLSPTGETFGKFITDDLKSMISVERESETEW